MPNTFTAPFVQTYRTSAAVVTAALTGIGTNAPLGIMMAATAGPNGGVVSKITAIPRGTVTASSLALFLSKASAPGVYSLISSVLMPAYTLSVATAIPEAVFESITNDTPIRLEAGDKLWVGCQVAAAAGIVFRAEWGDL